MNNKQTIDRGSVEKFHCPATGLPILRKPEWTDVRFGKEYKLTISIIGDNIVFFQSDGYATFHDVESALRFDAQVRAEAIPQNRCYVQITDWTNLKGTSQKARKFYLDNLKNRKHLHGLIIYGASPFLKTGIKLAKRFNVLKLSVTIADDYSKAVRLAQKLLISSQTRKGELNSITASQPLNISHRDEPSNKSITNPNWSYQSDSFSIRFEIINGNVLHGISAGRFEKEHITPSLSLQEEVTKSVGLLSDSYYFVLGLNESTGTGQKTRKLYVDAILNLYKKFPFQIFIFYGVNRLLTAAINLVRPFVPFKVRVTKDLDSALALISEEKSKVRCNPNGVMKKISSKKHVKPDHIKQYVDELLEFLEQINWSVDGINEDRVRDPSHPFSAVFDAIELIKWELDDRYRQHKQAEEELRRSEEQFRKIVESSPMGMHMYRLESGGRLVFTGANPAADTVLGVDNKQFIGKTIEEAFPSIVKTGVPDHYRRVCGRGEQWKPKLI